MRAAIDIGTNTVLLLVADVQGNVLKVIDEEQRIPRLGQGVDENKVLQPESMQRVIDAILSYKRILEEHYPTIEEVVVTATSAVRDAHNKQEFMDLVKEETGFEVRLLSGEEEARHTFDGAISVIDTDPGDSFFVLDIGGGSTEIAFGEKGKVKDFFSFDMGCVRFRERFLHHDPPFQEEIRHCREEIEAQFSSKKMKIPRKVKAVGVAGTVTSLAAINMQLDEYDTRMINGHRIECDKLSKGIEIFSLHTYEQLLELSPKFLKGREDIFLAGLLILEGFMKHFRVDEIYASTGGIRHGALLLSKKDEK